MRKPEHDSTNSRAPNKTSRETIPDNRRMLLGEEATCSSRHLHKEKERERETQRRWSWISDLGSPSPGPSNEISKREELITPTSPRRGLVFEGLMAAPNVLAYDSVENKSSFSVSLRPFCLPAALLATRQLRGSTIGQTYRFSRFRKFSRSVPRTLIPERKTHRPLG